MMVLIRKKVHFTDDAALPFRDTGFLTEKGVSRKGKQFNVRESVRDTRFSAEKGVSRQNKKGQKNRMRKYNRGREREREREREEREEREEKLDKREEQTEPDKRGKVQRVKDRWKKSRRAIGLGL